MEESLSAKEQVLNTQENVLTSSVEGTTLPISSSSPNVILSEESSTIIDATNSEALALKNVVNVNLFEDTEEIAKRNPSITSVDENQTGEAESKDSSSTITFSNIITEEPMEIVPDTANISDLTEAGGSVNLEFSTLLEGDKIEGPEQVSAQENMDVDETLVQDEIGNKQQETPGETEEVATAQTRTVEPDEEPSVLVENDNAITTMDTVNLNKIQEDTSVSTESRVDKNDSTAIENKEQENDSTSAEHKGREDSIESLENKVQKDNLVSIENKVAEDTEKDKEELVEQNDKSVEGEEGEKKDEDQVEPISENDDENQENPVFVHVNTEEKEDESKEDKTPDQTQEDEDFQNSQPQEDPIAADNQEGTVEEDPKDTIEDSEQGADEELCIIPDTERVISQEEKDAASALLPVAGTPSTEQHTTGTEQTTNSGSKFLISKSTDDSLHSCIQCLLPRKAKYISTTEQRTLYICDDNCLNAFKDDHPGNVVANKVGDLRVKNLTAEPEISTPSSTVPSNMGVFIRKCSECSRKVSTDDFNLSWETMDFCNELCLSKYQKRIASNCSYCNGEVRANCLGKYAVRFGYDIRQFCSSHCLEEYKKSLKVCSYCQKDISAGAEGFLAPAGDKGQFKDFCSALCMDKYNNMSQNKKPVIKPGVTCSVCLLEKAISVEYEHDGKMNLFCGEPCFVAFKFVNNIVPGKCDMCGRYFDFKVLEQHSIFYDDKQHSFCSKSCQNIYIIANRRIVPCSWCKVKKYNFDMIKRYSANSQPLVMCSLNCLGLHQVSVNALSLKKTQCDHCLKSSQPMYHLTMSDATTRNFCSYNCVMAFQNQFAKKPLTLNDPEGMPVPTGAPKRSKRAQTKETELPALPIISNVQSLAPITNGTVQQTVRTTRSKANTGSTGTTTASATSMIKHHIIIKPPPLPEVKNMMTMCKPVVSNKGISAQPTSADKECQTEDVKTYPTMIPIPVPIYVPVPLPMFAAPYPSPTPFPLPVPVPVFIPTTRNSANGILKEIKKIQVKIPTDPYEAELLMMAEMVAGDKKEENTDSESEEEDTAAPPDDGTFSPEPVDASNSFGDDMLQMALKMASELDEPAVDLEGALTASTITAPQGSEGGGNEENVDDPQPITQIIGRQSFRGKKRGMKGKGTPSKRGRRSSQAVDIPVMAQQQQSALPAEPIEKPDANMCLKYTFGVNAWKQWVTTKNAELEKSSRRVKLFKPEILQLTADELNYSLCLFVKEVRKPNGAEYAPDTIYYLCLGIQQYLFENGRIDNIFCDAYYEKFTDCLDEVARKFSVLYNDSHYIVTRVEEEHLWESKQLGAHSPHVLLSTLMFFNTKHFNLTTVDEHMQLSFSHIMKHWKRNPNQPGTAKTPGSRNVLLRFYPPQTAIVNNRKKKVYEQQENEENPLRCPVKLYEFYLSKCPESVKTRNDVFYLLPERSCVPDSPVWYSTMALPREALEKMLHRVKMVKEINVALLTS